jgi:hypothetical protein
MGYTFDGVDKIISLTLGTTTLDIRDMYSTWKEWMQVEGSGFMQALSVVGGEPVDAGAGIYVTSYFFLENGWKIKPQEASHKLKVMNGILVTSDGTDPFIPTTGTFNVMIQYSQPVKSETVSTSGGGGATPEQIADAVLDEVMSGHTTPGTLGKLLNDQADILARILGLNQENYRLKNPTYSDHNLTSATMVIYPSKTDADNDTNATATYTLSAAYDGNGDLTDYVVTKG